VRGEIGRGEKEQEQSQQPRVSQRKLRSRVRGNSRRSGRGRSALGGEAYGAFIVLDAADYDFGVFVLEDAGKLLAPLDEQDVALFVHEVFEAERVEFAGFFKAVEIDVEDIFVRPVVLVDEGERGAGYVIGFGGSEAFCNAFDEGGFSGTQIPAQQNQTSVAEQGRELASELDGFIGGVRSEIARHWRNHSIAG
jgi:hypothetical protein